MRATLTARQVSGRRHRGAAVLVPVLTLALAAVLAPAAGAAGTDLAAGRGRLAPAAIEGQVLGTFDPLGGATVEVLDARTGRVLASAPGDGSGYYRVDGIRPGDVKVRASAEGWVTGYADAATSFATAATFTLAPGQTLTQSWDPVSLYLDLTPVSMVSGRVTGAGVPLARATAAVLDATTGEVLGTARTGPDGLFVVGDLPGGAVKVRVSRPGWVPVYAPDAPTFATAPSFDVTFWTPLDVGDVALVRRGGHGAGG